MARMNRCPLDEGGLIGPITSIPYISNVQEEVVERRCPGAWWMKSPWTWQAWHRLAIIPQSSESISKLRTRLMSSTHAVMRFFEYFLCFLLWQAVEEDPIMRSAIQCSCDRIVVEFRRFPSNGGCFFEVIRKDVVQWIVDVRESPIPELWACWSF